MYSCGKMAKKNTSIRVDEELWKKAKKRAIDRNKTIGEFIEALIEKEVEE